MLIRNLVGQRFGKLTVIETAGSTGSTALWRCLCDCGNIKIIRSHNLMHNHSRSCGCARKETHFRTHGLTNTTEYRIWNNMKMRCFNERNPAYEDYGGRGITVCDRWLLSFENFYADMGPRPSLQHSIDRIDVNGNYEPTNCRWATDKEQVDNRRIKRIEDFATEVLLAELENRGIYAGYHFADNNNRGGSIYSIH